MRPAHRSSLLYNPSLRSLALSLARSLAVLSFIKPAYDADAVVQADADEVPEKMYEMTQFKVTKMCLETLPSSVALGWFLMYEFSIRNLVVVLLPTLCFASFMTVVIFFEQDTAPNYRTFHPQDVIFSVIPAKRLNSFKKLF